MPLELLAGAKISVLLDRAARLLGPDAVALEVRTVLRPDGTAGFELLAGDPLDAGRLDAAARLVAGRPEIAPLPPRPAPRAHQARRPLVIALVGPTGAGKTTTLAKLAAHPKVFGRRGVGLLTLDTYRVGAVDQLRTYAEISELPLEIVHESGDLGPALRRLRSRRVVLVDTPGRGPRRSDERDLLQHWLDYVHADEVHLVLPAGTRADVARRLIAHYLARGATHLIATKLDEVPGDGTLFDLAAEVRLPMRWVTDGQEVPFDLHAAKHGLVAAMKVAAVRSSGRSPLFFRERGETMAPAEEPSPAAAPARDPLVTSLEQVADALGGEVRVIASLREALARTGALS
ncbi:MAG TPA: hypothetical protein VMT21_07945 [Gemmatimonadales bacterium]|nr:hypothetical protein [Gemmatimonadales bacterium]